MVTNNRGFTIIELLIAIAMIGILSNLAYPSATRLLQNQRLTAGIQDIHSALLFARSRALKSRVPIFVEFDDANNTCYVFEDTGTTDPGNNKYDSAEERLLKTINIHPEVNLYGVSFAGNLNSGRTIQFNSLGFPTRRAAGAPQFFNGEIRSSVSYLGITAYKRVVVGTGGNIIVEKSTNGTNYEQ